MAFTETTAPLFNEFGESCTIAGVAQVGIFDRAYAEQLGVIVGNAPILLITDAALGAAVQGSAVVVRGTNYTIAAIEPDGTGFTLLRLET